jgi:curved DNA-binding protein CbpA
MSESETKINKKHITENQEYYKILELEEGATPEEIKKARDKLTLKWHPDKFKQGKSPAKTEEEATEMIQRINRAFEILYNGEIKESSLDSKEVSEVGERIEKWNLGKVSKLIE